MIVTVTNLSDEVLNDFDTLTGGEGPSALSAVGGARLRPLPYPFGHVVLDASGGADDSIALPMDFRDFRHKPVYGLPHEPGEEWNRLVVSGVVTFAAATQATTRDQEGLNLDTI